MVKCIKSCLKFLNFFKKPSPGDHDSKIIEISVQHPLEDLNLTSLQEKELNSEENPQIMASIKSPSRAIHETSPSKLLPSQYSPDKFSIIVSECNLSPISRRSHSEDLSPVKIASPSFASRLKPSNFFTEASNPEPKAHAKTPRSQVSLTLKRVMCPVS